MLIDRNNYEEFFLLYVDNELNAEDREIVEQFTAQHPDLQQELNLLKETVLVPPTITFNNKEELYKSDKEERKIGFAWWRMAAAVLLLFFSAGWGWFYLGDKKKTTKINSTVADTKISDSFKQKIPVVEKSIEEKEIIPEHKAEKKKIIPNQVIKQEKEEIKINVPAKKINREIKKEINKGINIELPVNTDVVIIDQPVVPQEIQQEEIKIKEIKKEQQPEYVDIENNNDNIYFANTTISKRNKLRGVFRKATRILDRVTSGNE